MSVHNNNQLMNTPLWEQQAKCVMRRQMGTMDIKIIMNTITSADYDYNESDDRVLSLQIYSKPMGNYGKDYSSFASDHRYYHHKVDHDYVDRHRGLVWQ